MRFHVIGLPHAPTTLEHSACAYTAKVFKFCKMMTRLGHDVLHYGVEGSNPECSTNVVTLTTDEYNQVFPQFDYRKKYYPVIWDNKLPYWQWSNTKASYWIDKYAEKGDFLCVIGGDAQKPATFNKEKLLVVEYGIGYYGTFAPFRVFESYAHMHHCYGREARDPDGKNFDAVIPNYWDLSEFDVNLAPTGVPAYASVAGCTGPQPIGKNEPYVLFMARMISRKGIQTAVDACNRAGKRLLLCGQGVLGQMTLSQPGRPLQLTCDDNGSYTLLHNGEHVGFANVIRRNELMRNAESLILPTMYLEPFGGVAVEAQLCGTPAITSDWGAFPETVSHGETGYRCRTLEQYVWALKNASNLDRKVIAERARRLYSLERVGAMYNEYFEMLTTLWDKGWYQEKPQRTELSWLRTSWNTK